MAHKHNVYDTDSHFSINPITKAIKNESSKKTTLVQFDKNSEIFSFSIARHVEGHDMSLCNIVTIHYDNIDSATGETISGMYEVEDLQVSVEDPNMVVFSWPVSDDATQKAGKLEFSITFECTENGDTVYRFGTLENKEITVSRTKNNGNAVVQRSPDILIQHSAKLEELENNVVDDVPKVFIDGVKPTTKDDVLAEMRYISRTENFHAYLEIKCQGTSSMAHAKKNFTIKMYADEGRTIKLKKSFKDWNHNGNKYVLKANFIDHSHARNIVCANLWDEVVEIRQDYMSLPIEMRNSPRNGAVDGFPIKVYYNGTYEGVYTWNIGKDDWMWNMDEDNANHVLLCGETNTDGVYSENACNFRALWSGKDGQDWSVEVGTNSDALMSSLNALITCVKDTDDETFRATISRYLDVQSAIDYYLHQYVIAGIDGLAKNMLLATYNGTKWICGAYDMDSTFGITPQGATSVVRANYACPAEYKEQFSLLWERIVDNFHENIRTRYAELRKSVYSYGNIVTKFERFMDLIGTELFDEDATIYSIPSATTNNIKFIRNFTRDRLAYTDAMIPMLGVGIPATGLTLDKTNIAFENFDPITITATVTPDDCTEAVVWSSSDTSVAIVDGGVVTPLRVGNCTIAARCGFYRAECSVLVKDGNLEYLEWTDGYYLSGDTGKAVAAAGDSCTDFVNLRGATKFVGFLNEDYTKGKGRYHLYDINKDYIGYIGSYDNLDYKESLDIPDGAVYVRFYAKTEHRHMATFLTDVFKNGFVQPDASKFVPDKKPSASGIVTASNNGYFDESIPVYEGQMLCLFNGYRMDYTGEADIYGDRAVYCFDSAGNYVDTSGVNAVYGNNGQFMMVIPAGVTSVKIGFHNSSKDYAWYRVLDV